MAKTKRNELSDEEWDAARPKTICFDYGQLHQATHKRGIRPRDGFKILQELSEHELDVTHHHEYTVFPEGPAKELQEYFISVAEEARLSWIDKASGGFFGAALKELYAELKERREGFKGKELPVEEVINQTRMLFFNTWNFVYKSNEPTDSQKNERLFWAMAKNWIIEEVKCDSVKLRKIIERNKDKYGAEEWNKFIEDQRKLTLKK